MADPLRRLNAALADRFRLEREVGRGGMATVYLAQDLKHRRPVAMKVLLPELCSVVGGERFLREIEVEATLRHPHILPLLDSGETDGLLWYTMPFVEGESLRDRLRREKQLPINDALRIAGEVADALDYSHAHGVVHRDVKPSNIMLDSGHAVVTDFGIALVVRDVSRDRLTQSGLSPGSPEYMSPEQAAGEHELDSRSDLYSLGCVLYEMLAGDPPYTGSIPQAILAKKLLDPVPSVRVVRDSVPEHVAQTVAAALAKHPADRLKTASEFRRGLEGDLDEGVAHAAAAAMAAPSRAGEGSRLAGRVAVAVATVVGLLATVGVFSTRVYDLKLGIPIEHTPSRDDFLVVGAHALFPALFFCFLAAAAYVVLRLVVRMASAGLHRVPVVGQTLDSLQNRTSAAWRNLWRPAEVSAVADLYFVGSIAATLVVLAMFRELLGSLISSDTEVLSCARRELHHAYSIVVPLLTAGLALSWVRFVRFVRRRSVPSARVALAKWGGLVWVMLLAIVMTMPWRLLWDNEYPRALVDGEPAYVLVETDVEWVVYPPGAGAAVEISKGEGHQVERLGTSGYLFEAAEAFLGAGPGC